MTRFGQKPTPEADRVLAQLLDRCPDYVRAYCEDELAQDQISKVTGWIIRAVRNDILLRQSGLEAPEAFFRRYPHTHVDLRASGVLPKYRLRAYNLTRELLRVQKFMPDLLSVGPSRRVLDLSSGACGVHEVLSGYGHEVISSDFYDIERPQYGPIYDALKISPVCFDGRALPLPFETKSVDYLTCYQAINEYGPYCDWDAQLDDIRSICRTRAAIVFNVSDREPGPVRDYVDAYCKAHSDATPTACPDTELPALIMCP